MSYARQFRRRHASKVKVPRRYRGNILLVSAIRDWESKTGRPCSPAEGLRRQIYLVQREMPQRRWRYWGWVDAP